MPAILILYGNPVVNPQNRAASPKLLFAFVIFTWLFCKLCSADTTTETPGSKIVAGDWVACCLIDVSHVLVMPIVSGLSFVAIDDAPFVNSNSGSCLIVAGITSVVDWAFVVVIMIWLLVDASLELDFGNDAYVDIDGSLVNIKSFPSKLIFEMRRFLSAG